MCAGFATAPRSTLQRASIISDESTKLTARNLGDPLVLIATGAGCGFSPLAPGTIGSLLGAVLWWFAFAELDLLGRTLVACVALALATVVVQRLQARKPVGDSAAIVVDEIVGIWFALLAAPKSLYWVVAGFLLFRELDIAKPWPISWADRNLKGGLGIMVDDVMAGVAATGVLAFLGWTIG